MILFGNGKAKESIEQYLGEDLEGATSEDVEYAVSEVNRLGLFDVFNYYNNQEREKQYNQGYAKFDGLSDRQNYLLNLSERVNCSLEKTKQAAKDFYQSWQRG